MNGPSLSWLLSMHNGELKMERIRTFKKAVASMLSQIRDLGTIDRVALIHAHAVERLDDLRQIAGDLFDELELPFSGEVTSAIGAHVGPGAIGVVCVLKPT